LHPGLEPPGPRANNDRPLGKKNMRQLCFSLLPDGPENGGDASPGVPPRPRRYRQAAAVSPRVAETLRADQDARARLRACGPDALTPVEALTVLLGERSLVPAARLLAAFGSLTALARASHAQLVNWVSPEKAMRLTAALRLNALVALDQAQQECLDSPEAVYRLLAPQFAAFHEERLMAVLLDTRYRLLKTVLISTGTVNESLAHPREIFKPAIAHSAYAFILAHQHPSGDASPSDADRQLTRRVAEAARLLQIHLLDHVICGTPQEGNNPGYFSFKGAGLL
jgi:DNA repair protein RadC